MDECISYTYEDIYVMLRDVESDINRFDNGNNKAGSRVKVKMSAIIKKCKSVVTLINEIKNARKKEKSEASPEVVERMKLMRERKSKQ